MRICFKAAEMSQTFGSLKLAKTLVNWTPVTGVLPVK